MDLSKLKAKTSDTFPAAIEDDLKSKVFFKRYEEVINVNFGDNFDTTERLFDQHFVTDQFTHKHLLPLYLCKITNPDQSLLLFDSNGQPKRGLRTFGEIAHYVRCIPYQQREGLLMGDSSLWCSPDFTMTIKVGTEDDHALLMASIFRTVKHED